VVSRSCDTWQRRRWVPLIRSIFEVDPHLCQPYGAEMRISAFITELRVVHTILRRLAAMGVDTRNPPGPSERHPTAA
jgi:hypothetical protein